MFICVEMKSHFPSRSHQYHIQCVCFQAWPRGSAGKEMSHFTPVRQNSQRYLYIVQRKVKIYLCNLTFNWRYLFQSQFLSFNDFFLNILYSTWCLFCLTDFCLIIVFTFNCFIVFIFSPVRFFFFFFKNYCCIIVLVVIVCHVWYFGLYG